VKVTTKVREEDQKMEVTIALEAEEAKKHIDAYYKKIGRVRIPGFRPGKAPRKILDQHYGGHEAVMEAAREDLINEVAPTAVDGEDIMFISNPEFEDLADLKDGEDFSFVMVGKVKPQMELLTYDPVEITMPPKTATEAGIREQIEGMRKYYYDFETITSKRKSKKGDFVLIDLECKQGDEEVQGMNGEGRLVELGAGTMPKAFEKEVTGMKAGESKEFDFEVKNDAEFDYIGEEPVHAKVELTEIREKTMPKTDEELAERAGVESFDKLKEMIKEAIDNQLVTQWPKMKERRCNEELAKRLYGQVPVSYQNFARTDVLRDFYNNLERQGYTFDMFLQQQGITTEEFNKDVEAEAKDVAEQSLALDALARHLEFEVTDEDIDKEFEGVEGTSREEWEKAGRMSQIREGILREKASNWLIENAVVTIDEHFNENKEEDAEDKEEEKSDK
jgi:trigger factor